MGKGEIARYEQFLLFPQFFSKDLNVLQASKNQCFFGKCLSLFQIESIFRQYFSLV